jgi:WD40 repeat protein
MAFLTEETNIMPLLATLLLAAPVKVTPAKTLVGIRPVALAAAPSGSKFLACLEDGSVRIIDAKTKMTVRQLDRHPGPAYAAAWSADGNFVATGDETARIWIHNALTGKKVREYRTHTKGIQKLSFNLPGTLLLSTGKDDQCNVYDLRTPSIKERLVVLGKGVNFYGGTFHPKLPYSFAVGMLGGGVRFYDALTGKPTAFLTDAGGQGVFDFAFNPAGTRGVSAGRDGFAVLWDPKTLKKIGKFKGHGDWVVYTAVSPNGQLVATGSSDRTVRVWDIKTMTKVAEIDNSFTVGSPVCFTADGTSLVSVTDAGDLQISSITPAQASVAAAGSKKRNG